MSQWLKDTFGDGGALAIQFVFALIVVLVLLAALAWLLRRFASGRFGSVAGRNRQPRLAIMDAAPIDTRRRLVLVRRDNVEHLLLIGGPTDVVVEQQIVRGMPVGTPHPRAADRGAARRGKVEPGTAEAAGAAKAAAAPARAEPTPSRAEPAPRPKPELRDTGKPAPSDIERTIAARLDDGIRKAPREPAAEDSRAKPAAAPAPEAPRRGFSSLRTKPEDKAPPPIPVTPVPAPEPDKPAVAPEPDKPALKMEPEKPAFAPEPDEPKPIPEPELSEPAPASEPVKPAFAREPDEPAPAPEPELSEPAPAPEPDMPAVEPAAAATSETVSAPVRSSIFGRPAAPEVAAAPEEPEPPAPAEMAEPEPEPAPGPQEAEPAEDSGPETVDAEAEKSDKDVDSLEDEMAKLLGEIAGRPKS